MFCIKCRTLMRPFRLANELSPRMVCLRCEVIDKLDESVAIGVPRFVDPRILIACLKHEERGPDFVAYILMKNDHLPSWLSGDSLSILKRHLKILLDLLKESSNADLPLRNRGAREVHVNTMAKLKKELYGEERSKDYFDPRKDGEHSDFFSDGDIRTKGALSVMVDAFDDLQECSLCSIWSDKGFLTVSDKDFVCLGCLGYLRR